MFSLQETSDDEDYDYGLVQEYFKEDVWQNMPRYLKKREKNRFEFHEQQVKQGKCNDACYKGTVLDLLISY